MKKEIILDQAAQNLFKALGGIDTSERGGGEGPLPEGDLSSDLEEEERRMDDWRILMVEFVFRLAGFLRGLRLAGIGGQQPSDMDALLQEMERLSRLQDRSGRILLRFRGMLSGPKGKGGQGVDYVLSYGPVTVDIPIIRAVVNRRGVDVAHLPGRLAGVFDLFGVMEITTCRIDLGPWTDAARDRMRRCLEALGHYFVATSPALSGRRPPGAGPRVVLDSNHRPDPNLTMLAGVNRLTVESAQGLADKVTLMMRQADPLSPLNHFTSAYEAIFAFRNLKEKLVRSPIEINNVRWLIAEREEEVISREQAAVGRLVLDKYNDSPTKAAMLMQSIYGADFHDLEADALDARLGRVTDFLERIEADGHQPRLEDHVLGSVRRRLDEVPDEIFANLTIGEGTEKEAPGGGAEGRRGLHVKLQGMLSFFKRRFGTRQKIREMMNHPVAFDERDYETIAEDFGIPVEDARNLVDLLKGCFDERGSFLRPAFEKNIPAFAGYEKKVFEFLWYYLKEIRRREDRVAFLNATLTLIDQMNQRTAALRIILGDFLKSPDSVSFSDRNALILANLLVRTYNKELRMDIEISPEEILRVKNGLNPEAIRESGQVLDQKREAVSKKIRAIHRKSKEMLDGRDRETPIPIRYLLSLERECYIFLALVGGPLGHRVLYGAVKEYGNPQAEIYHLKRSGQALKGLLQLLRVTVRGLARFGEGTDILLMRQVRAADGGFYQLTRDETVRYAIEDIMKWIDAAIAPGENGK